MRPMSICVECLTFSRCVVSSAAVRSRSFHVYASGVGPGDDVAEASAVDKRREALVPLEPLATVAAARGEGCFERVERVVRPPVRRVVLRFEQPRDAVLKGIRAVSREIAHQRLFSTLLD